MISAYMVDNGQCYSGETYVTIDCVPGLMVRYDCDSNLIVYDTSKYRDGFTIPDRTITIEGTSCFATLTDTNRITSIPVAGLSHGQYTVTMDMGMDVPCSVSREFVFEGNPIIDSITIRRSMCEGRPFQFLASTSGTVVQFRWNFGDGAFNKGNGIYHTYDPNIVQNPTITLTVTDVWGCLATDTANVTIGYNNLTGTLSAVDANPVCPGQNRVIEYVQDSPVNEYFWNHSPGSTSENHYNTTSTGDYYLYIETSDFGCRAERMCNVGFLNAPTARITGNTEYCLGELVKLNGNTGNSNTYLWYVMDQDNTCIYTSTSSIIRFTPGAAGNYTAVLNVTSPYGCSVQAVYHFVVHPRPVAPRIVLSGCIHEPPVQAICITGQSLLWSNGFNGTQADYYTDGYISAYYIDATTGCPSDKAYGFIEPAPNYDALLTGCYKICPDSLWTKLPVYGFYPYYPSPMQWHWLHYGLGEIDHGADVNPQLPLADYGTYILKTEYGDGCVVESPELQIERREYCPCEGIELNPEKMYCYVEDCKMYYHLSYTVSNQGSNTVTFSYLQVSPSAILVSATGLPMTIPAGGSKFFEFDVEVTEFMNGTLHFSLIDPETGCEKQYSDTLLLEACMDEECNALTSVQGPNEACLGSSILLSASPTQPNYFLQWQPLCPSATPSSVDGEEVTISYDTEVCDVAVYQVDNEYGCRSEVYIHTVDTFRLAPFTMPAITHVCAGASVHLWVDNQSANVTYEWTISPANAASVNGSHFANDVHILTNHLDNLPVIATVTLKRTYCSNIVEYETVQISIENVTVTVDYEDTICDKTREYFYASGTHNYNNYTWIIDSTDVLHGYNPYYYFGTPGTHYFTLTYQPYSYCDAATVSGQIVVVDGPSVSIISSNDTLSVAQLANVTYSWTFNGDTIPNMHDTICFVADTGDYCCIVTSTIPPYCSDIACFSNESSGTSQPDACQPLELTDTLVSCTEAVIKADNTTNSIITWSRK